MQSCTSSRIDRYCPLCENKVNPADGHHVYRCAEKFGLTLSKNKLKYVFIRRNFPKIARKKVLFNEYVVKTKSLPEIRKKYGIDFKGTLFLLRYFGIPRRTQSESSTKITVPKSVQTYLRLYGTTNALAKGAPGYEKKNRTVRKKYNVDNVFQLPKVKKKVLDDNTYIVRYGLTRKELLSKNSRQSWKYKTKVERQYWLSQSICSARARQCLAYKQRSRIEKRFSRCLKALKIDFIEQFVLSKSPTKHYVYDFYFSRSNLLLEIQGDYWHANPIIYAPSDCIFYTYKTVKAEDVWHKDVTKANLAITKKYRIAHIWENELLGINSRFEFVQLLKRKKILC